MATTKRTKRKQPAVPTPQNIEEAAKFVREAGEQQSEIERITIELAQDLKNTEAFYVALAAPHVKKREELIRGLCVFAQTHRGDLTEEMAKAIAGLSKRKFKVTASVTKSKSESNGSSAARRKQKPT